MPRTRRQVIRQVGLLVAGTAFGATAANAADDRAGECDLANAIDWGSSEDARRYRDALVWDNHSGFEPRPDFDLERLEEWRKAGVDYLSIDVGYDVLDWQVAIRNLGSYISWLEQHPDRFLLVHRADDVLRAKRLGRMAITFDLEGMNALNGEISMVALYYRLGVRQMLVAYNRNNLAGGGCHDEDRGLTPFGRRVIMEMNRVGMVVDCSHSGYRTTMEVMDMATQPVVFSHSNPKALRVHGRNVADEQIRACARTGGVVAINGIGLFLPDRNATTQTLCDCIVYVRDLVGDDHVGIGLDYAPPSDVDPLAEHPEYWPPAEYANQGPTRDAVPGQIPEIAVALRGRGWSESGIRKVMGGNLLRVAQAVWK